MELRETPVSSPELAHERSVRDFSRGPVCFGQSNTMCGRIVDDLTTEQIAHQYRVGGETTRPGGQHRPNYNLRPTGTLRAVRLDADGKRELAALRWGFVPHWSHEVPKQAWINAKAETIAEKGMWKKAFAERRALVPVTGFYEWQKLPGGKKQPFYIFLPDEPMTFAGVWETWHEGKEDELVSGAVATAEPSKEFERFHDRQVVILHTRREQDAWLDPDTDPEKLLKLLRPLPAGHLQFRPVGPAVNALGSHGPECIKEGKIDAPAKPLKIKRPARKEKSPDGQEELL